MTTKAEPPFGQTIAVKCEPSTTQDKQPIVIDHLSLELAMGGRSGFGLRILECQFGSESRPCRIRVLSAGSSVQEFSHP